jgi:hypothetical protein
VILARLADGFLYAGLVGVVTFTVLYGLRSKWWKFPESRALFAKSSSLVVVAMLIAANLAFGDDYWGRQWFRAVGFGVFFISAWWFAGSLIRAQHRSAKELSELLEEYRQVRLHEVEAQHEAEAETLEDERPREFRIHIPSKRALRKMLRRKRAEE